MNTPLFPDYQRCGVNLANSILAHFKQPTFHPTLPEVDQLLDAKEYQNVIIFLADGLGSMIADKHLKPNSFLQSHKLTDISAVFPPTTTAATTSIATGRTPAEHGWLGWNNYIPPVDAVVTMYRNYYKETREPVSAEDVSKKYFPFTAIVDTLTEHGIEAHWVQPYERTTYPEHDLQACLAKVSKAIKSSNNRKFIYAYYTEPDYTMHDLGTTSKQAHRCIERLDKQLAKFAAEHSDTLLIVTADHGHHDLKYEYLCDIPELYDCLLRPTSLETRAVNFFLKPEKVDVFPELFAKYFPDGFYLMPRAEVFERQLFGPAHPEHPLFRECIGDYIAISIGELALDDQHSDHIKASSHGGLTPEEMIVPLFVHSS